jgi:hypothetical protein
MKGLRYLIIDHEDFCNAVEVTDVSEDHVPILRVE